MGIFNTSKTATFTLIDTLAVKADALEQSSENHEASAQEYLEAARKESAQADTDAKHAKAVVEAHAILVAAGVTL